MSKWDIPVVFVTNKMFAKIFCMECMKLNALTSPDAYPMPTVNEMLDQQTLWDQAEISLHTVLAFLKMRLTAIKYPKKHDDDYNNMKDKKLKMNVCDCLILIVTISTC